MSKAIVVLNHENGDWEIYYSVQAAMERVDSWMREGAELDNITVMVDKPKKLEKVEKIVYEYRIKD